jgi:hypothetical protein
VPLHVFSWGAERNGDKLVRGGGFVEPERFQDCARELIRVFRVHPNTSGHV